LLLSGLILDRVVYPINYQIVFGIGIVGAAMSSFHLVKVISQRRLREGLNNPQPILNSLTHGYEFFRSGIQSFWKAGLTNLLRLDLLRGSFGPFITSYTIFYMVLALPVPIYTLFLVDTIKISDGSISRGNALFYIAMILSSLLLARVSKWLGHKRALVASGFSYFLYPFVGSLAQGPTVFYVASIFGGASWGIASGALISRLFERTPEGDRPTSMALYNLALNLGTMVGVFAGSGLAEWLGLRSSLMFSGILRLVGTLVLIFWG
jgi:MFS family permease